MNGADLTQLLGLSAYTVGENTKEMTHEDSLRTAPSGSNCANWVVGHILAARNNLLGMLGAEQFWPADRTAVYDRGSAPINAENAVPFSELLADFGRSQERLQAALGNTTEADLEQPLPEPHPVLGETLGSAMSAFVFHEAYHAGQVGILRRVAGKAGAIA